MLGEVFQDVSELNRRLKMLSEFEAQHRYGRGLSRRSVEIEETEMKPFATRQKDGSYVFDSKPPLFEGVPFALQRHPRFVRIPSHRHRFLELMYIHEGSCRQVIGGQPIEMKAGQICLLGIDTLHEIEPAGEGDIILNLIYRRDFVDDFVLAGISKLRLLGPMVVALHFLRSQPGAFAVIDVSESFYARSILLQMAMLSLDENPHAIVIARSLFVSLVTLLEDLANSGRLSNARQASKALALVADTLNASRQRSSHLRLLEVAAELQVSSDHLGRLIRSQTGTTFTELLHRDRLRRAEALLKTTDWAVSDISRDVGYTNVTHFYKLFRRRVGVTPGKYRTTLNQE